MQCSCEPLTPIRKCSAYLTYHSLLKPTMGVNCASRIFNPFESGFMALKGIVEISSIKTSKSCRYMLARIVRAAALRATDDQNIGDRRTTCPKDTSPDLSNLDVSMV
jgi:hypothetical protein